MAVRRSLDFWLVAYFLSRCGQRRPHGRLPSPPTQLGESWHEAYSFFFLKLNGGRTLSVFSHSLKNARDAFDGHHDSGRVGWRDPDSTRPPKLLNADAATVLAEWKNRTDAELWSAIEPFADFCTRGLSETEVERLATQEIGIATAGDISATEGRELLKTHRTRERNRALVLRKKRLVLYEQGRLVCEVCDFDFATAYGQRGIGFAECHHTEPISESVIGRRTRLSELAVVCANCHRMLHRQPWLSVSALRQAVCTIRGR